MKSVLWPIGAAKYGPQVSLLGGRLDSVRLNIPGRIK